MLSRLLARSDARFLSNALSPEQRIAALARLKEQRVFISWVGIFVVLMFAIVSIPTVPQSGGSSVHLAFLAALMFVIRQSLDTQIRILELLQHDRLSTPDASKPQA